MNGLAGLLNSTKGTLCLLTLAAMTYLAHGGHLDGIAFSAGCGVLTSVFCWTQHKTTIAALLNRNGGGDQPK